METTVNIQHHRSHVGKEALANKKKKEKIRASKTNWPQSKAAYVRFPVLLLLLPRRVLWLCLHELTLTLLRSGGCGGVISEPSQMPSL